MNLPFLSKNEPEKNFFLSLLIKPYKISAILFEEINNKLIILATNEAPLESDIDQISADELLQGADRAISAVEPNLPEGVTVEKTIFSLPYDWIIESKIKDQNLDKLKTVCSALGLTPIGYLTSIEAIVHFIDKSEGAPVSAVFIEITKSRVFSYIVRAGKIIEELSETISENALATSEQILKKVTSVDVLPAKIILLDLENSASVQQEFLSHKWPATISFLHVPQVVVLEQGFENEAVVNGVATQMELEVMPDVKSAEAKLPVEDGLVNEKTVAAATDSDFGFVKGEDIAKSDVRPQTTDDRATDVLDSDSLENITEPVSKKIEDDIDVNYFKEHEKEVSEEAFPGEKAKFSLPINIDHILRSIKKIKLPASFPKILSASGGSKNKIILVVGVVVAALVLFAFVYYNFLLAVNISVFEDTKAINKSTPITFSKEGGSDNSIKLNLIQEEVKGDEDKNSTGKKETGDKAKGSVTIYNKTEGPKTFEKGVTVVGPNSLEFILTDDVKIASTSSFSTNLSSASVKVEASKFGKEYNIPSSSNFTVKGFTTSDFIAKNSDATSGGSSKTTTVVSAKDLSDLQSLLTQKLQGDAVAAAKSEATGAEEILPTALSSSVKNKKYTKKEGDEAAKVGLSATIVYDIGKYDKNGLAEIVKNLSKNEVPGTYVLQQGDSQIEVVDIKPAKDGESASATLKVKAVYSPKIDSLALAKSLKGKSIGGAEEKIKEISGVSDVTIKFSRKLPLMPNFLPFNSKNITIEIKH